MINAMIYCRGHRASFDRWNLPGWRYRDLLPYFGRIEDEEEDGASAGYGRGGPLRISRTRFRHPYGETFLAACQEAGIPVFGDLPASSDGAGFYALTQRNGFRETARSYLEQTTARPNLRVRENVLVTRILFDKDRSNEVRACGAEFVSNGKLEQVRVRGEVILCAGAIGSPVLLQRSGIGPEALLRQHGIRVLAPRNSVGANLRDHVRVPMVFAAHRTSYSAPWKLAAAAAQYAVSRTGLLTSNTADLGALIRSDPSLAAPDLRLIFKWRMAAERPENCVGVGAGLLDPASAGSVRIASANPQDAPQIDPAYLQDPEDLRRIRIAMERAREIMATQAAQAGGIGEELLPGVGARAQDEETYVRATADSSFHVVGACAMGDTEDSAVDLDLRVRGVAQPARRRRIRCAGSRGRERASRGLCRSPNAPRT